MASVPGKNHEEHDIMAGLLAHDLTGVKRTTFVNPPAVAGQPTRIQRKTVDQGIRIGGRL